MGCRHIAVALAALILLARAAAAVPITVSYGDPPLHGFFARGLGALRRRAFEFAVQQWADTLAGTVPIVVAASMPALGGTGNSALLASAGPTTLHRDFPGGAPNTWYPAALANELSGSDLNGSAMAEISVTFNADVDRPEVLGSIKWHYGLDGEPGSDIDFVTVALHELGHGLGFTEVVDPTTGGWQTPNDEPAVFDRMLARPQIGAFTDLRDAERLAAVISSPLLWDGPSLTAFNGAGAPVFTPDPFEPGSSVAHWDPTAEPGELMSPFYTGAVHDPGLLLPALADMGWQLAGASPTPRATAIEASPTPSPTPTLFVPPETPPMRHDEAYVSNFDDGTVSVVDESAQAVTRTIPVGSGPLGVAATADGRRVYVANFQAGTLSVISTRTGQVVATVSVGVSANGVAVTPDGTFAVVTDTASDRVAILDTRSANVVARVPAGAQPTALALDADGRLAFAADYGDASVTVVDVVAGLRRAIIPTEEANQNVTGLTDLLLLGSLAIDPHDPSTLYVVNSLSGVVKSTDAGLTWHVVNSGLPAPGTAGFQSVVVDPHTSGTLYLGADVGIFKSTDAGATWAPSDTGLTNSRVLTLAVDPVDPNVLYAGADTAIGSAAGVIFKSTDAGMTWSASASPQPTRAVSLAVDPHSPSVLYAAANLPFASPPQNVFKSMDGGLTWTSVTSATLGGIANALAVAPTVPPTVYAGTQNGVFTSTDGGATWSAQTANPTRIASQLIRVLGIDPSTPDTLYVGTVDGIYACRGTCNGVPGPPPPTAVDEFVVPTSHAAPYDVTAGPDGNVWFADLGTNAIGWIVPSSPYTITEVPIPTANSGPFGIAAGPDDAVWFTESTANQIGRITAGSPNTISEFALPTANSQPLNIAAGPDGNLWFTEQSGRIGRIAPSSPYAVAEFPLPSRNSLPLGITAGPDGNVWFTEASAVGRITPESPNAITEFTTTDPSLDLPMDIVVGPDGNLWFTDFGDRVGRILPESPNTITEFPLRFGAKPEGIAIGTDGSLWFTADGNRLGRISPTGPAVVTEFPLPGNAVRITSGPDGNLWFTETDGAIARLTLPLVTPSPCAGDCNADGRVTVDKIIRLVNIVLGNARPNACPVASAGPIQVQHVIDAVDNVLLGCL